MIAIAPLLLLASLAHADESRGKLIYVHGDVTVIANGKKLKAVENLPVNNSDTVITGADSSAIVMLADGSTVKLKDNTEIGLGVMHGGSDEHVVLKSGSVFSDVGKQKKKHFWVRTTSAVMGVRGTQFFTGYGKEGKAGTDVWMCVKEGEVGVEVIGKKEQTVVSQGKGVYVEDGKKLSAPKAYEWTKKLNWNMDPKKGDVEDHTTLKEQYTDLTKHNYD